MTVRITLAILASHLPDKGPPSAIATRLAEIGHLTEWCPGIGGGPAKAYFRFENEATCELFVTVVRGMPGVAVVSRENHTTPEHTHARAQLRDRLAAWAAALRDCA